MSELSKEIEDAFRVGNQPLPEKLRRALVLAQAGDRLNAALRAGRLAINLTVDGHAMLLANATPAEAETRLEAMHRLLHDTFTALERHGRDVDAAMGDLYNLILTPDDFFPPDADDVS